MPRSSILQIPILSGASDADPAGGRKKHPKKAAPESRNVRMEEHGYEGMRRSVSPQPAARPRRQRANQRGVAVVRHRPRPRRSPPRSIQPGTVNGQRSNPATQAPLAKTIPFFVGHAPESPPRAHAHVTLTCSVLPLPATYIAPPLPIFAITHTNTLPLFPSLAPFPTVSSRTPFSRFNS